MGIPTRQRPVVTITDPETGASEKWVLPAGFTTMLGAVLDYVAAQATIYQNDKDLTCPDAPGSSPLDPQWTLTDLASLVAPVAGTEWSINLYWDQVGQAATGQTLTDIDYNNLPGWLSPSKAALDRRLTLFGTIPAGLDKFYVPLRLDQTGGRQKPKTFEVNTVPANVYLYLFTYADTRFIRPLMGGSSSVPPTIQIVDGPTGYDKSVYPLRAFDADLPPTGGQHYYWACEAYQNMPNGQYAFKAIHQGVTRYFKVIWTGQESAAPVTLLTTQPSVDNGTAPPPAAITVTKVDVSYTPASGSLLNKLYTYIQLSGTDQAKIAYEQLDSAGTVVIPKSSYFDATAYSDGTGYQWRDILENMGAKTRLYIRPASNAGAEVQLVITRPSAASPRTTIYPAPTTGGTPISGGTPGDDPAATLDLSSENPDSIRYYNNPSAQ